MKKNIFFSLITLVLFFSFPTFAAPADTSGQQADMTVPDEPLNTDQLADDKSEQNTNNKNIALLLPLQGKLADAGRAVRNGVLSAYYQHPDHSLQIRIYDTSKTSDINAIYKIALKDGAQFVIGPLEKQNVESLSHSASLPVQTLALNYLSNPQTRVDNLYQFGLSPLDEAQQTALRAWSEGKHSALILYFKNDWGSSVADAFAQKWNSLGGQVVGQASYSRPEEIKNTIEQLLQVDRGISRHKQLTNLLGEKTEFTPHRRKDADFIFLVGTPGAAPLVLPLLNYYFASDLPVYATSSIFSGTPQTKFDQDLNGIIFCDIPWVFGTNEKSQHKFQQVSQLWPTSVQRNSRLYALGIDAYNLLPHLNDLSDKPLRAETGKLSLTPQLRIVRQLMWAKIKNGSASVIT